MHWKKLLLVIGMISSFLAGCLTNQSTTEPLIAETIAPATPTPTSTTVWFPATPTVTLLPSTTPDANVTRVTQPSYSGLIIQDNFDNSTAWITGRTGSGTITMGPNELTLAVNRPGGYLYSLRQNTNLRDYYLEITASPTICQGGDEYGLLVRVSPGLDFLRFSLTCDGQVRIDRLYQGKASSPIPATMSGAVPRGGPSLSRLAVFAKGRQLDFYVNDEYQFTINDPLLAQGGLGVFVRAAGEGAVTVNFSDLKVYEID